MRLAFAAAFVGLASPAGSQTLPTEIPTIDVVLLKVSGKVSSPEGQPVEGVAITLKYDIDASGTFSEVETAKTTTNADGKYEIEYTPDLTKADTAFITRMTELQDKVKADGPTAIFKDLALTYGLEFEKIGQSTVYKKFSILNLENTVNVYMVPLQKVACGKSACLTPDGGLEIVGLSPEMGIRAGYAQAYSPDLDPGRFAGNFTAKGDDLLTSAAFMEVDFRDAAGNKVKDVASPVTLRWRVEKVSWPSLIDTTPGNDRIDVGIYTYSTEIHDWIREADGHLQNGDGEVLTEADLTTLKNQTYPDEVYTVISTTHFSSWNTDHPDSEKSCVKGRVVDLTGLPFPGVEVEVRGRSYQGWTAPVTTGPDGYFVAVVKKGSEVEVNPKVDGQIRQQILASTSNENVVIMTDGRLNCLPAQCACQDVGEIELQETADVKICQYRVKTPHTGTTGRQSRDQESSYNPGAPAEGATIRISKGPGPELDPAQTTGCTGTCYLGLTDSEGVALVSVPMLSTAVGNVFVQADQQRTQPGLGVDEFYNGQVPAPVCAEGGEIQDVTLPVNGNVLRPLDEHMDALAGAELAKATGCGCFNSGDKKQKSGPSVIEAFLLFLPLSVPLWRRRSRGLGQGGTR